MKVQIIDHTQNPIETIYRAYRICYSKDVPTEIKIPTIPNPLTSIGNAIPDYDKMLDFIKKHSNHQSCLEHVSFTFAIEGVSRSLSHQLVRHRLASYSQQSQRYVQLKQFEYIIPPNIKNNFKALQIYKEIMKNDQIAYDNLVNELMEDYCKPIAEKDIFFPEGYIGYSAYVESVDTKEYNRALKKAIEDARYVFPNACCTNLIMTMNCRELINFFSERLCIHAQWEIRKMAKLMNEEVNILLPIFARKDVMRCSKTCFYCNKNKK